METVFITGANRGIGLELTKCFLALGNKVIATTRHPDQSTELNHLGHSTALTIHQLEVTDSESVSRLRNQLNELTIDVLINCAGIMGEERQSIDDMDYTSWMETFEVNTIAPFRITTAFRKNLQQSNKPRVATLSSQMGSLSRKSTGSYSYRSSKAAVNKVMQVLAVELEADGIVVCPVHPGWVRTDMGGDKAEISVEESAAGLLKLINSLTMEHSGRFWTWQGLEHSW